MRLDRNINPDGRGKYALVKIRAIHALPEDEKQFALRRLEVLHEMGVIDFGDAKENDFFVLRLKDMGAPAALHAYAEFFKNIDPEWASEVKSLADKAYARFDRKMPD